MTAYGRASVRNKLGSFVIEIQSLNRKFLDIAIAIHPKELGYFEAEIREWVRPYFTRGHVAIKCNIVCEEYEPVIVAPNIALALQIKGAWEEIGNALGMEGDILSLLKDTPGIFTYEVNKEKEGDFRDVFKLAVESAIEEFMKMKNREGIVLQEDIRQRLEIVEEKIGVIEKKMPAAANKYREKLMGRLEELLPGRIENEERIVREIALFAEKIDITEEIVRFRSHIAHCRELMNGTNNLVGKPLEFVLQELGREINTVGSKSSDIEVAHLVIDIKSELERIREQIQNIE